MPKKEKHPFKKISEAEWEKLEKEAKNLFGQIENGVWYPNNRFLEEVHKMVIEEMGGYTGYEAGIELFDVILEKVKGTKGIHMKASVLLRNLITSPRIYGDGNHRTAFITVVTFLEKNGKTFPNKNVQEISKFIKGIMKYDYEEIAEWLKNGC